MEPRKLEAKVAATLLGFKGGSHPMVSTEHIVLFHAHTVMHRFRLIRWFMFEGVRGMMMSTESMAMRSNQWEDHI